MANLTHYDVILAPVLSEKSMKEMANRKYTFKVAKEATKTQIKEAVEKVFEGVKVDSVNTMLQDGKVRRRGMKFGRGNNFKKAIVTLTKESKEIELFSSLADNK